MTLAVYTVVVQEPDVIVLHDEGGDGDMTVTNDAEAVVADVLDALGLRHAPAALRPTLVYRDSEGVYDELVYNERGFRGFSSFGGVMDLETAVAVARERRSS